ncbi:urease accessory protein [Dyadobacter frigoris]|uniref:Urease accessory protein n=1 Tax=Dyadobacter frigoris TaxID=2576211 RepID=A0A4V6Y1U2_9BACT|nr:urease accessory protein [Dyadobacter frigoris]TKT87003.1 urease accessory protein [Dyadobacter frigoris]GLU52800.1 hydantoin utilization protein A [Dyadobacter frigoris]
MEILPLLLASLVGFTHAFEADHLVAVSSIVTRRNNTLLALKDGIFWGLGHTSTILLVGCIFILGTSRINLANFKYLEGGVGIMLIFLGLKRLSGLYKAGLVHTEAHRKGNPHEHKLAYSVGLMHGLAGSGTLIFSVLTTIKSSLSGMAYLMIFGMGSIAGMMVAAGIFSVPFSEKLLKNKTLRIALTFLSSLLCIILGGKVVYQNFIA